jgi:two-component system sensor kinase
MTTRVFEQIRHQTPERDIKITIGELPPAMGDPSLIEQVMVNLLANAIKFTSSRKTAVIEVGGHTEGKEAIYYVKDNGVGFNEQFAHNLYGVFERLHSYDDYEGSGVGLSIVKSLTATYLLPTFQNIAIDLQLISIFYLTSDIIPRPRVVSDPNF